MLARLMPGRTVFCAVALLSLGGTPALAAVPLPGNETLPQVDFERHVMGIFGRAGCNAGSCHGSFQGRGGFRLSLFGYDPEKDYRTLTRDALGRRLNLLDPDRSEVLLKATGQVPHEGGKRFARDSWQYRVLHDWIAAGAPWQKGSGQVAKLTIEPPEYAFRRSGETGQLRVLAQFHDGSTEEITTFCDFRTNDEAVAEVTAAGQVRARQPGDTAIVVSYRGNVVPVRVLVPLESSRPYPQIPEINFIDREVIAKLQRLNIVPSDRAGDAEFLRRVTIDTIGTLPTPEEVRAFLADRDPEKRTKKIDELLAHPMHAALWATKFCDITGNNTDALENPQQTRARRSQMWYDWLRKRLADNVPYDEIVRGILCATSRDGLSPEEWLEQVRRLDDEMEKGFVTHYAERATLDLFWRRQGAVTVDQWGEKTAAAFLGVRLECAQCHKHPFDRWTQADYRAYANIFSAVAVNASPQARKLIAEENARRANGAKNKNQVLQVREVYLGIGGKGQAPLPNPDTGRPLAPRALGGPEIQAAAGEDPRVALFEWMRSPENPFFARSLVNRVWGHYFGVGIVDPVDDFSLANPPSNPKLLDALAKDFLEHHYDLRRLERLILTSHTYQLSSATNSTNRLDRNNFAHAYVRPMLAEVVVDVVNEALGTKENFGADAPPGCRAIEVGASRLQNNNLGYVFRIFGRPPRTSACDCERALDPALPQKLYLMSDQTVLTKIRNGRLMKLLASEKTDDEVLEELFLATVSRLPTPHEREVFEKYKAEKKSRLALFQDTLWALVNTREFILNH